jgi:predicted metal-dependent phosphoesterase TrpH
VSAPQQPASLQLSWQQLERIDLHTHSDVSDGTLAPATLVAAAAARHVQWLALTDHDTVAGCAEAAAAATSLGLRFIPGIELTATWLGREVHIVGLNIDVKATGLLQHCAALLQLRRERLAAIGTRLQAHGLPGVELATAIVATARAPTRMHMARELVARGFAVGTQPAFDRWLNRGCPGYVAAAWPEVAATVACINAAGGIAVLAHAHRYRLSNGGLRELCAAFRAAGGAGIEVSLAGCSPGDTERAAALARRYDLCGSFGSDFHEPGIPWRPLGRMAKLPDGIQPVTARLAA